MKKTRIKLKTSSKFKNKKVKLNGITFDSIKEAHRYSELTLMQKAGEITELQRQVEFELIPTQKEFIPYTTKTGKERLKSRVIERPVKYIADFVYTDKNGQMVVEDVKSDATRTKDYVIKRKLMLFKNGIKIKEI
jgi:hypothetical protein